MPRNAPTYPLIRKDAAIKLFDGNGAELARALGIEKNTLYQLKGPHLPAHHAWTLFNGRRGAKSLDERPRARRRLSKKVTL